ncbi:hypothetical protein PRUPE_6G214500 [Prunus persica]|uniref:F-box associated beta-propeller type 1 domain-containing protein n=1 Tax=Prunus persica TaxID=3760 RepID=A0A251NTM4_PRUPE|nr:hypothetical protein PRUPE_6G214500 [Prunus persica]
MVSPHGALLNEALHWFYNPRQNEQCICAFDLAKEEFRVMPLPVLSEADKFDLRFQYLGVLEGCLSLSGWKSQGSIEIWVMKEYGLRESWNHLFKFDIVCYVPVLVSKSGNIVVKQIWSNDMAVIKIGENGKVVFWDYRCMNGHGRYETRDVIEYDETLLWVNHYEGLERQGKILKPQHVQGTDEVRKMKMKRVWKKKSNPI